MSRFFTALKLGLGPPLGFVALRLLWSSYRIHIDEESMSRLEQLPEPSILAHWHDQIFISAPFMTRHLLPKGLRVAVMVSPSMDGELAARIIRRLGLTVVRGSASRGGSKALRSLYRLVKKKGESPVFLPDGPKGPAYKAKPGAVVLSQLTGTPIVPLGFQCSSAWTLGSWDRLKLPKPFSRIDVHCGSAFQVSRNLDSEELSAHCDSLAQRLTQVRSGPNGGDGNMLR